MRPFIVKLKHPLKNTCPDQKKFVLSNANVLEKFADGAEVVELT